MCHVICRSRYHKGRCRKISYANLKYNEQVMVHFLVAKHLNLMCATNLMVLLASIIDDSLLRVEASITEN